MRRHDLQICERKKPPESGGMEVKMQNCNVQVRLGSTEIIVNKNGFGALPVQIVGREDAARLLRKAYE